MLRQLPPLIRNHKLLWAIVATLLLVSVVQLLVFGALGTGDSGMDIGPVTTAP